MLVTDPRFQEMNETQILWELENVREMDREKYEEFINIGKIVRQSVINVLGLNLMPIEDEEGNLRRMREGEFMPLMMGVGQPELLKSIVEKMQELDVIEKEAENIELETDPGYEGDRPMTPEELDSFMSGGDIEFVDDPEEFEKYVAWNSVEAHKIRESLIKPLEDDDSYEQLEAENTPRTNQRILEQVVEMSERPVLVTRESPTPQKLGKIEIVTEE